MISFKQHNKSTNGSPELCSINDIISRLNDILCPLKRDHKVEKNDIMSLKRDTILFQFPFRFYTPPHNSGGVLWFHVGRP